MCVLQLSPIISDINKYYQHIIYSCLCNQFNYPIISAINKYYRCIIFSSLCNQFNYPIICAIHKYYQYMISSLIKKHPGIPSGSGHSSGIKLRHDGGIPPYPGQIPLKFRTNPILSRKKLDLFGMLATDFSGIINKSHNIPMRDLSGIFPRTILSRLCSFIPSGLSVISGCLSSRDVYVINLIII